MHRQRKSRLTSRSAPATSLTLIKSPWTKLAQSPNEPWQMQCGQFQTVGHILALGVCSLFNQWGRRCEPLERQPGSESLPGFTFFLLSCRWTSCFDCSARRSRRTARSWVCFNNVTWARQSCQSPVWHAGKCNTGWGGCSPPLPDFLFCRSLGDPPAPLHPPPSDCLISTSAYLWKSHLLTPDLRSARPGPSFPARFRV